MSNVFKEQTKKEFDAEMWEALAQIERGETYSLDEVLDEIEKEPDNEIQSKNIRISKGKSV